MGAQFRSTLSIVSHETIQLGNSPVRFTPCGARTRPGAPCRCPAMWSQRTQRYTRCRKHGGASTGPRTPEGLERSRNARWIHGDYSAEARRTALEIRLLGKVVFAEDIIGRMAAWQTYVSLFSDEAMDRP